MAAQLTLPFDRPAALLSPDELYASATPESLKRTEEDRRVERKAITLQARQLGECFSLWSKTSPEGGLLVLGISDDGKITGCRSASQRHLHELEKCGATFCPDARFAMKRIPAFNTEGAEDFLILIRVFSAKTKSC